jgi:hypothetical protein
MERLYPIPTHSYPPTFNDIILLGLYYPQVKECITLFEMGHCTKEQMLIYAVLAMARDYSNLHQSQVELLEKRP